MNNKKRIKIFIPPNQFIKVKISENENIFISTLSKILNIKPFQIKGLKDSKGNYFTLSSFLRKDNIERDYSDTYFELILSKNIYNQNGIFEDNKETSIIPPNFPIQKIHRHSKTISMDSISVNEIQNFFSYLLQLLNSKQINESQFFELNKMMSENNQQLITQFKYFLNGKINNENFIFLLKLLYENRTNNFLINQNEQFQDYYFTNGVFEKMKEFFPSNIHYILKEVINTEEYKRNINKFNLEGNLNLLINYFQEEINKIKKIPKKLESFPGLISKNILLDGDIKNKKLYRTNSSPENIILNNIMNVKQLNDIKNLVNKCYGFLIQLIFENHKKDFLNIIKIYDKQSISDSINLLNNYCKEYLNKKIAHYIKRKNINFPQKKIDLIHDLIESNNPNIILKFSKSKSIKSLIKKLISFINNETNDKIIENFIKNLSEINYDNAQINIIKQLIKIKEPKILEIIENYKKNKYNINSVEQEIKSVIRKESFSTLTICKLKVKDSKETTICPKINERKKYIDIHYDEQKELEEFKKIITNNYLKDYASFLIEKYVEKNSIIKSIFDVYLREWNFNELISSLNIFLKKELKLDNTPINISNNNNILSLSNLNENIPKEVEEIKKNLSLFINPNNNNRTENITIKQKEIISILFENQCIDNSTYDIIYKKIDEDDKNLISAFEVYSINKDHHDFIETLNIIAMNIKNYKIDFYHLLNLSHFNHTKREELISLYNKKDKDLFKILSDYDDNQDVAYNLDLMKDLLEKRNKFIKIK